MTTSESENTQVLIAGAGPSGLMAACRLTMLGINYRIIDKASGPPQFSGALFIQSRTLEILDQMGLAGEYLQKGQVPEKVCVIHQGKQIFEAPIKEMGEDLSKYPFVLMLKQGENEAILLRFLEKNKSKVQWNTSLEGMIRNENSVTAIVVNERGERRRISAGYLIAADGAKSTVGSLLKIPYQQRTDRSSLFIFDGKASFGFNKNGKKEDFHKDSLYFAFKGEHVAGFFPLPGDKWRIDGIATNRKSKDESCAFEDIREQFSKDLALEGSFVKDDWFSTFRGRTRLAQEYIRGRCFLVGDAAHVHTPIAAQGMNTGMQDSYNLTWKMAMVLQKDMPEDLLRSYESERLPVARKLIRSTDKIFFLVIRNHLPYQILRNMLFPFLLKMLQPFVRRRKVKERFFKSISETEISYRRNHSRRFTAGLRPGDRLPHLEIKNNGNREGFLHDKIRGDIFVLLFFDKENSIFENLPPVLKELQKKEILEFAFVPYSNLERKKLRRHGIRRKTCLLIRPDVYIEERFF